MGKHKKRKRILETLQSDEWGYVPPDRLLTEQELIERFMACGYTEKAATKMVKFIKDDSHKH